MTTEAEGFQRDENAAESWPKPRIGNANFAAVSGRLGWGDPEGGVWFIGIEEGLQFDRETIEGYKKESYEPLPADADLGWLVATKVARIMASLLGHGDHYAYRDSLLYRKGSKVFSGNVYPLGKRAVKAWPDEYESLFGLTRQQYDNYDHAERWAEFRKFRDQHRPKAIVCFGKGYWDVFEDIFVSEGSKPTAKGGCRIHECSSVILTKHFSRGFIDTDLEIVVKQLRRFGAGEGC